MKRLTMTVFLTIFLSIFASDVQAQPPQIDADWFAVDFETDFGFPLNDGTRLDHNSAGVDVSRLDVAVEFNWNVDASVFITDYIDRVEWAVQHSGQSYSTSFTTHEPESDGSWLMCNNPCRALQTLGSVTISARAIYDNGHSVFLVASDSRAFRVVDTTRPIRVIPQPTTAVPRPPSVPYCFGDSDGCDEVVGNASLWQAYVRLCGNLSPGSVFAVGKGASIQCPA